MSDVYTGQELDLFRLAENWKRYLARQIPLRGAGRVLEVGAGLGATTGVLCDGSQREWICLEPDRSLAERLQSSIHAGRLPRICTTRVGTLAAITSGDFDVVLYVDVLEHIQDDANELVTAGRLLAPGGQLVVLSPAHPWLFSRFDAAIGHVRRYTRSTLRRAGPAGLILQRMIYLDAAGMLLSLGNRLLLRQSLPTEPQILFWDRWIVPLSQLLDPLFGYRVGKSILGVWRKAG